MERKWFAGILTVIVGGLGIIVPIGWDYYKSKVAIDVRVLGKSVVISRPEEIEGLVVSYNGETLNELSKISINVANVGRMPIQEKDVSSPLAVRFSDGTSVIDAAIDDRYPENLEVSMAFNRAEGVVVLNFPLLNPGDSITFSALSKTKNIDFEANARIAGLSRLEVVKVSPQDEAARKTPWYFYFVGVLSVGMILISFVGLSDYRAERKMKRAFRSGELQLPLMDDKADFVRWVDRAFKFTTDAERAALKELVLHLPDSEGFVARHEAAINSQIKVLLDRSVSNLTLAAVCIAIGVIGSYYTLF